MTSQFKITLNRSGVRELLRSDEMQGVVTEYASRIRSQAGEGYAQDEHRGRNRVNASVWPKTKKAYKDNLKNNTLLKAVH